MKVADRYVIRERVRLAHGEYRVVDVAEHTNERSAFDDFGKLNIFGVHLALVKISEVVIA